MDWIRNGEGITGKAVIEAVDNSLRRLQTEYIDLYQLHWPNRATAHFGRHWPGTVSFSEVNRQEQSEGMLEILKALDTCIRAGKIRHFGLSDDTTWGINEYLKLSDKHDLPRPVSIQNEFSLVHAKDWPYLIENCIHEGIAYLPWSPLAGGMLSGKYANGERPEGSRWSMLQRNGLFRDTDQSRQAVKAYVELAQQYDLTSAQLALAWCKQVDGVTSTIVGATTMEQLKENMDAFDFIMSSELQQGVLEVFQQFPVPF